MSNRVCMSGCISQNSIHCVFTADNLQLAISVLFACHIWSTIKDLSWHDSCSHNHSSWLITNAIVSCLETCCSVLRDLVIFNYKMVTKLKKNLHYSILKYTDLLPKTFRSVFLLLLSSRIYIFMYTNIYECLSVDTDGVIPGGLSLME